MKGFFDGVPQEVESIALVNGYSRLYAFWQPGPADGEGRHRGDRRLLLHLRLERVRLLLDPRRPRAPRPCR